MSVTEASHTQIPSRGMRAWKKKRPPCGNGGPRGVAAGCGFDPGSQGRQMMMMSNKLKPSKSINQYVAMATVETISKFLCIVWVSMFEYDRNLPQNKIGEKSSSEWKTTLNLW